MNTLKRSIRLPFLICYGLGTILGAGIYVLIGKVAGISGENAPLAFLFAAIVASFTAYSYARLSSLYPKSAGEAVYIQEAFGKKWLSSMIGFLIVLTGIVSAATIANGFVGYLNLFLEIPEIVAIIPLVLLLGFLAFWGIQESIYIAAAITMIELVGLAIVLWAASPQMAEKTFEMPMITFDNSLGIALGAFLAFYAYIGFEDMVNVAEEVYSPEKNLPLAIGIVLFISTGLYVVIAYAAISSLSTNELANSNAPLALIVENAGYSPKLIGAISLFAVVNGALVQIIMASRVIYGMASQGMTHPTLAYIHPKRRTPSTATLLVTCLVLVFALGFPLVTLAKLTSLIILIVFAMVNLAYFKISKKKSFISLIGFLLCISLLLLQVCNST